MKHQLTLLGGQLLPVYLGIKAFEPDTVHLLYTRESEKGLQTIKDLLQPGVKIKAIKTDAFDHNIIKKACESVVAGIPEGDELSVNLTGGTKMMALACQAIVFERQLNGFYINQNNTLLTIPGYKTVAITYKLLIDEFFRLSRHNSYTFERLSDYNINDRKAVIELEAFGRSAPYREITSHVRNLYKNGNVPISGDITLDKDDRLRCRWVAGLVEIYEYKKLKHCFKSIKIIDLFFHAGWWELSVALNLEVLLKPTELLLKVKLPFTSDSKMDKNEIDILINDNNKLIFIECKSGYVTNMDINKMKIVKQVYGGLVSKSVLASVYPPSPTIKEKCQELDISMFTNLTGNFNGLAEMVQRLGKSPSL